MDGDDSDPQLNSHGGLHLTSDQAKGAVANCELSVFRTIILEELRLGLHELQERMASVAPPLGLQKAGETGLPPQIFSCLGSDKAASEDRSRPAPPPLGLRQAGNSALDVQKEASTSSGDASHPPLPGVPLADGRCDREMSERSQPNLLKANPSTADGEPDPAKSIDAKTPVSSFSSPEHHMSVRSSPSQTHPKKHKHHRPHIACEEDDSDMSNLQRMTQSKCYERASGILILINAVFIGWQTQFLAEFYRDKVQRGEELGDVPVVLVVLHAIFAVLFTLELAPRWMADGFLEFFRGEESWWNVMDVFVVFVGIAESLFDIVQRVAQPHSGSVVENISAVRVLRVVRVVRVVRVIRVMKFFRELRMMVYSILGSMKNLMWVMVILGMSFYLFGVTFTSGLLNSLENAEAWRHEKNERLLATYGTVDRAILHLFMSMSGGNSWAMYYEPLESLPIFYRALFLAFIMFTIFAIVNIVTGVFVESALQSNLKDRDILASEELQQKKAYLDSMQELFEEMDEDQMGTICMVEFELKLQDERVIAFFHAMKLDVSDAHLLFQLLDTDSSGEISIGEFLEGVYKLQGESRSLDVKMMQLEVSRLCDMATDSQQMLRQLAGTPAITRRHSVHTVAKSRKSVLNTLQLQRTSSNGSSDPPRGDALTGYGC